MENDHGAPLQEAHDLSVESLCLLDIEDANAGQQNELGANVLLRIASCRFFDSDSFLANKLESDRERVRGALHRSDSDAGERSAPEMRRDDRTERNNPIMIQHRLFGCGRCISVVNILAVPIFLIPIRSLRTNWSQMRNVAVARDAVLCSTRCT